MTASDSPRGFFRHLADALQAGPAALATVVSARGSTPRLAGARQFFTADGASFGSVGGGAMEGRVIELARQTLQDGQPRAFEADLRGRPGDIREGICGGLMTVWIHRLEGGKALHIVENAERSLQAGRRITLVTEFRQTEPLSISTGTEAPGQLEGERFTECLHPSPRLLIVGAGHIGRALARLALEIDFNVLVVDDRPEWLIERAFPDCTLASSLATAAEDLLAWQGPRFAALVSRGFPQDIEALKVFHRLPLDYLGLLGSSTRIATVLAVCREWKHWQAAEAVLHAPIGEDIQAETPEEIAVSIAAEMIRVRRAGKRVR